MDQYSYNEAKLEYCVCGADFEPRPCTCGYYPESNKNTKEVSRYGQDKSNVIREATKCKG